MYGGTSVWPPQEDYMNSLTPSLVTVSPGERIGKMPESEYIAKGRVCC